MNHNNSNHSEKYSYLPTYLQTYTIRSYHINALWFGEPPKHRNQWAPGIRGRAAVPGRMSFYRALSKSLLRTMAAERAVVPWPGSPEEPWEKPWETMGRHGKSMEKTWENCGNIWWWSGFHGRTLDGDGWKWWSIGINFWVAYFWQSHILCCWQPPAASFWTLLRYHQEMQMTPFEQFCKERGLGWTWTIDDARCRGHALFPSTNCQVLIQSSWKSGWLLQFQANIYPLWFKYVKGPFERYQPLP